MNYHPPIFFCEYLEMKPFKLMTPLSLVGHNMFFFYFSPYSYAPSDDYLMAIDYYEAPWNRFQPYLIGMLMGYILWQTKGKEFKVHWALNLFLWACSFTIGVAVIFGLYSARRDSTYFVPG